MLIQRPTYTDKLLQRLGTGRVKILNGPRKCGKSTLLFQLFPEALARQGIPKERIRRINFHTIEAKPFRDPRRLIRSVQGAGGEGEVLILLLDEVHLVDGFVDVLYSLMQIGGCDIFLTDSRPDYLARELLPELFGEGEEVPVYPFTVDEQKGVRPQAASEELWNETMRYGGMPGMLSLKTEDQKEEFLHTLLYNTGIRALATEMSLRKPEELETLVQVLAQELGSQLNPPRLREILRKRTGRTVSDKTIKSHLELLEEQHLIRPVRRLDILGNRIIQTPLKYYFSDLGLCTAADPYGGGLEMKKLENQLVLELLARGFQLHTGVVEARPFDEEGHRLKILQEVTLVAKKGSRREYLQLVSYPLSAEELRRAEEPLLRIRDSFPKHLLFAENVRARRTENGIIYQSIPDFLKSCDPE